MSAVHKQRFSQGVAIVSAAKILSVGLDGQGKPSVWFLTGDLRFAVVLVPTGFEVPESAGGVFVGTFTEGAFVWHAFTSDGHPW